MEGLELFHCDRLHVRLTKKSCGERHLKGEACQPSNSRATLGTYGWSPVQWERYAMQCRGCPIGAKNAKGRPKPKRPPIRQPALPIMPTKENK